MGACDGLHRKPPTTYVPLSFQAFLDYKDYREQKM